MHDSKVTVIYFLTSSFCFGKISNNTFDTINTSTQVLGKKTNSHKVLIKFVINETYYVIGNGEVN